MDAREFLRDANTGRQYRINGCIPSPRPPRDENLRQPFGSHMVLSAQELPDAVDLRPDMTPVEDQSILASCVANAFAGAYEYLLKKATGKHTDVSRLFIYYNARTKMEGSEGDVTDSGCTITSGIEALNEFGTCLESEWSYDTRKVNTRPSTEAYTNAKDHQVTSALEVGINLNEMKTCLAQGYPFVFGVRLFESFTSAASKGVVSKPDGSEESRKEHGNHAMLVVGYSDAKQAFIVRNSWRDDWGENGYCYMSYDYLTDPEYVFEPWTVRALERDDMGHEHWINEGNNRNRHDNQRKCKPKPKWDDYATDPVDEDSAKRNTDPVYNSYEYTTDPVDDPYKYTTNTGDDPYKYTTNTGDDSYKYNTDTVYDPYSNDTTSGYDPYSNDTTSGYDPYKNDTTSGYDPYKNDYDTGVNQFDDSNNFSTYQYDYGNDTSFDQFRRGGRNAR